MAWEAEEMFVVSVGELHVSFTWEEEKHLEFSVVSYKVSLFF